MACSARGAVHMELAGAAGEPVRGGHPIGEFCFGPSILHGRQYYGCYYSPDDVPRGFQNVEVTLVPDGENRWTWRAEGDNHGMTKKISDKWYYFEAWL